MARNCEYFLFALRILVQSPSPPQYPAIAGGIPAEDKYRGSLVRIFIFVNSYVAKSCTGTKLNEKWAGTAAHCAWGEWDRDNPEGPVPKAKHVSRRLGLMPCAFLRSPSEAKEKGVWVKISCFDKRFRSSRFFDIALLELETEVTSSFISVNHGSTPDPESVTMSTGYGIVDYYEVSNPWIPYDDP